MILVVLLLIRLFACSSGGTWFIASVGVLLIGALVALFAAVMVVVIVLTAVEMVDRYRGTTFARPGHYMTVEECDEQGLYWQLVIDGEDNQMLGNAALLVVGSGVFLGCGTALRQAPGLGK